MSESNNGGGGGASGYEDYDIYGGSGGYQSAIDYSHELEIQEKIRLFEEKMMRATLNRQNKIHESQERLQYQHEIVKSRISNLGQTDHKKVYETLQRYCDRQVKSRKIVTRKTEEREDQTQWKKQKDTEKETVRKMRIREQL